MTWTIQLHLYAVYSNNSLWCACSQFNFWCKEKPQNNLTSAKIPQQTWGVAHCTHQGLSGPWTPAMYLKNYQRSPMNLFFAPLANQTFHASMAVNLIVSDMLRASPTRSLLRQLESFSNFKSVSFSLSPPLSLSLLLMQQTVLFFCTCKHQ